MIWTSIDNRFLLFLCRIRCCNRILFMSDAIMEHINTYMWWLLLLILSLDDDVLQRLADRSILSDDVELNMNVRWKCMIMYIQSYVTYSSFGSSVSLRRTLRNLTRRFDGDVRSVFIVIVELSLWRSNVDASRLDSSNVSIDRWLNMSIIFNMKQ
jgi:hypothetical protein